MEPEPQESHWLAIARLGRSRGRKGELTAEVLTDFPERFTALRRVFLEGAEGGEPVRAEVTNAWWHEGRLILHFAGVESISEAERLRGRLLLLPRDERMPLPDGCYYHWQLVGCEVLQAPEGSSLGTVIGIEPTGGADVLRVKRPGTRGREVLIPFARAICREIDVTARRILIEPPEGLLELNEPANRER